MPRKKKSTKKSAAYQVRAEKDPSLPLSDEQWKKWKDCTPEVTEDVQKHTESCPACDPKEFLRALWKDPDGAYHVMCVKCGIMGPAGGTGSVAYMYWNKMPRSGIAKYDEMQVLAMNILHRELERYNELSENEELDEEGIQTVARMSEAAAVLGDVWG